MYNSHLHHSRCFVSTNTACVFWKPLQTFSIISDGRKRRYSYTHYADELNSSEGLACDGHMLFFCLQIPSSLLHHLRLWGPQFLHLYSGNAASLSALACCHLSYKYRAQSQVREKIEALCLNLTLQEGLKCGASGRAFAQH
jgi:hypothetical protein